MSYSELCEAFGALSPDEQTLFIDARIDRASHGALCGEVQKRIFNTQKTTYEQISIGAPVCASYSEKRGTPDAAE